MAGMLHNHPYADVILMALADLAFDEFKKEAPVTRWIFYFNKHRARKCRLRIRSVTLKERRQ